MQDGVWPIDDEGMKLANTKNETSERCEHIFQGELLAIIIIRRRIYLYNDKIFI